MAGALGLWAWPFCHPGNDNNTIVFFAVGKRFRPLCLSNIIGNCVFVVRCKMSVEDAKAYLANQSIPQLFEVSSALA